MRCAKSVLILCAMLLASWVLPVEATTEATGQTPVQMYCHNPEFKCIKVKRGQTWQSLFPNPQQRDIVMRLNRTNLQPWAGKTIVVPKDLSKVTVLDVAPFPNTITAPGHKTIIVQPALLAWGAYDSHGHLVHWGPMSGGKSWCADISKSCRTATGAFIVYDKRGKGCKSSKYPVGKGGAPMPYCMFFHGGFALHASPSVPGHHASHGCVRIFLEDANWLNQSFVDMPGESTTPTEVIVKQYGDTVPVDVGQ